MWGTKEQNRDVSNSFRAIFHLRGHSAELVRVPGQELISRILNQAHKRHNLQQKSLPPRDRAAFDASRWTQLNGAELRSALSMEPEESFDDACDNSKPKHVNAYILP